jgi:RimJ/RimL family protein N-acetyltransferase
MIPVINVQVYLVIVMMRNFDYYRECKKKYKEKQMKFNAINLKTERLSLRKLKVNDVNDLYEIYSDELALKYWSEPAYTDIKQCRAMVEKNIGYWDDGSSVCLALEQKLDKKVIGTITIFAIHEQSRRAEIGYILSRQYWKTGLMSEAINAIIKFSFNELNLNRLEADIDPENLGSAALLKKYGFKLEGYLKERWIVNDVVTDSELYGLLNPRGTKKSL